jgi:hypothetical protein
MKTVKFATQIDEKVAADLRSFTEQTDRSISSTVNEALVEYLARHRVRPAFRESMSRVLDKHGELLARLAK